MDTPPLPAPGSPRRLLLGTVALLAVVLVGTLAARFLLNSAARAPATQVALVYPAPRALPPFTLTAGDGSTFDASRLRGHFTFVLFGYTNCPDVCPTTLIELKRVRELLADLPARERPAVVLVSVDPKRDTPERLSAYVTHFDPTFVGLTGAQAQIGTLAQAVGVAIERGEERDGSYSVDHTAALFLIDPGARVAAVFPTPHAAATIAGDYRAIASRAAGG